MLLFSLVAVLGSSLSSSRRGASEEELVDGGLDDVDVSGLQDVDSLLGFEAGLKERLDVVKRGRLALEIESEIKGLVSVGLGVKCLVVPSCTMAAQLDGCGASVVSRAPPSSSEKIRKLKNLDYVVAEDVEKVNELLDAPPAYTRVSASRARFLAKKNRSHDAREVSQRLLVPFDTADASMIERPLSRVVGVIVDDVNQTEEAVNFAEKYRSTHPRHVFALALPFEACRHLDDAPHSDLLLDDIIYVLHERDVQSRIDD